MCAATRHSPGPPPPCALTIAGSDSCAGAGAQADLKTFTALGVYGLTAMTAVTAQDPARVHGVEPVSPRTVRAQIDAAAKAFPLDAVKTGMLVNEVTVNAVADALEAHGVAHLVVDPVLVATSGDALLEAEAQASVMERLFPMAEIVTPNLPELRALTGIHVEDESQIVEAAAKLLEFGPNWVLVKGGHALGDEAVDLLVGNGEPHRYAAPRVPGGSVHGTGCTLSAAIAAYLAKGRGVAEAVAEAKQYVSAALESAIAFDGGVRVLKHWGVG